MLALDPNANVGPLPEAPEDVEIVVPNTAPPNFNSTLWALLQDVKAAGIPLSGKIAEYAGFYRKTGVTGDAHWDPTSDNGANPDKKQTGVSQPNKSLDKLTFMIMFHLPFRGTLSGSNYGDPLGVPTNSWSFRANALRVTPLHKLNSAGEQVDGNGKRCDDTGTPLDSSPTLDASLHGLDTPAAYAYYENIASNLSGAIATAVKGQPLFLYLALVTEGRFNISSDANDVVLSVIQTPANINGLGTAENLTPKAVRRRREVELGMYQTGWTQGAVFTPGDQIANFPPYEVNGNLIEKETSGGSDRYFVLQLSPPTTNLKIYVRLKYPAEELTKPGDHSLGSTVFELKGLKIEKEIASGQIRYYATYYTTSRRKYQFGFIGDGVPPDYRDNQFDNMAIADMSGVTMGWGYDIGQGFRKNYQYNIVFNIWKYVNYSQQPSGTNSFVLRYKDRSISISFNANAIAVRTALLSLLQLKSTPWPNGPDTITVSPASNTSDQNYPSGWAVKIIRTNMDPGDSKPLAGYSDGSGFMNIYSSNVFYQVDPANEPVHQNITITPIMEKDRYVVNQTDTAPAAWAALMVKLNTFFGVADWRLAAFPGTSAQAVKDRTEFEALLRGCFAIRRGNAFLPVFNQNQFMKRFRLPMPDLLFPRWIKALVIPDYYKPKMNNLPAYVKSRTNAAERYVLTTIAYMGNVGSSADVNEAIREKSFKKLAALIKHQPGNTTRRDEIKKNLQKYFQKQLYRNIVED